MERVQKCHIGVLSPLEWKHLVGISYSHFQTSINTTFKRQKTPLASLEVVIHSSSGEQGDPGTALTKTMKNKPLCHVWISIGKEMCTHLWGTHRHAGGLHNMISYNCSFHLKHQDSLLIHILLKLP